jgi:chromosome segregation ATPase
MSTSTVSRVEEHSRMADVEATFEDRYARLKLVALKLKKRTVDQESKIKELMSEAGGNAKISMLSQNCVSLQKRCDELADVVDEQRSSLIATGKDLEAKVTEYAEAKQKLAELEESNKRLKAEREALSRAEKNQNLLDMELETAEKRIEDLTGQCKTSEDKVSYKNFIAFCRPVARAGYFKSYIFIFSKR